MALMATIHTSSVHSQSRDKLTWGSNRDGSYLIKEGYLHLSSREILTDLWPWKLIWRTKMPPKVVCFSWIILRGRKFYIANICYKCFCNPQSISHLFLHCTGAETFEHVLFLFGLTWTMPSSLKDAFVCWSSWKAGKSIKKIWSLVPLCTLW